MATSPRRAANRAENAQTTTLAGAQVTFRGQVRKMLRHPLVFLTCGLAGAGLLGGYSLWQGPTYEAKSTVLVYALSTDPTLSSSSVKVDIDTESSIAQSREVAALAAAEISSDSDDDVRRIMNNTEVSGHSQTSILDVTGTAKTPELAADRANAVAQAYLDVQSDHAQQEAEKAASNLQDRIKNSSGSASEELQKQLAQVQSASTTAGRIITSASAPTEADGLSPVIYALVGLAGGVLVALPLAYVYDSRKRKLSYPDRAQEILGVPVNVLDRKDLTEDLQLALHRAGITSPGQVTDSYRGLAVYSPRKQDADTIATALSEFTGEVAASGAQAASVSAQPAIYSLSAETPLIDVLNVSEELGYGILVLTPQTPTVEVSKLHRNLSASTATYIPLYILK